MLEEILQECVGEGMLTQKQLEEAKEEALSSNEPIYKYLRDRGLLQEEKILPRISQKLGIPFKQSLSDAVVPEEFVAKVPVQFARTYTLIGTKKDSNIITVATANPLETEPIDELEGMLGCEVDTVVSTRSEITALINRSYVSGGNVEEMLDGLKAEELIGIAEQIDESEDVLNIAYKAPIVKLVNMLFFEALRMRASDIHLQPYEDKLQVRYRIDGILHNTQVIPKKVQDAVISRIKVMGKMDIAERRLPQDGRTSIRVGDSEVDVRISSVPTSYGERIVLRLLDKSARLYTLDELGLDPKNLKLFDSLIHYSHGIIFVTGPTGSGKTTTLYAVLQRIDSLEKNILTIEDPIEYNLKNISQIQVSAKKGLTFAQGLRSLLRQDPNIMMVGEVRDVETARIAVQSALTGHLVFSTLHTNDAPGAITRMIDIGVEPYLVSSSLIAVVAQRLVRTICEKCKEQFIPKPEEIEEIMPPQSIEYRGERGYSGKGGLFTPCNNPEVGELFEEIREGLIKGPLYRGKGCHHCLGTGYWGRTGIYELLPISERIKELTMKSAPANEIKRHAVFQEGMKTLRMDGAQKVVKGITTIEEVVRVTQLDAF